MFSSTLKTGTHTPPLAHSQPSISEGKNPLCLSFPLFVYVGRWGALPQFQNYYERVQFYYSFLLNGKKGMRSSLKWNKEQKKYLLLQNIDCSSRRIQFNRKRCNRKEENNSNYYLNTLWRRNWTETKNSSGYAVENISLCFTFSVKATNKSWSKIASRVFLITLF